MLQCMRITDQVALNCSKSMFTAAFLLYIEKAFHTTWHPGLLYKLSELNFSSSLVQHQLIPFQQKFRVKVEDELSTPRDLQAGVLQGSVLSLAPYSLYINDTPQTPGVYLALFADDAARSHPSGITV